MAKKTVAVLFGGASSEYEVSLLSATSVLNNIPSDRYEVVKIGITKEGRWLWYGGPVDAITGGEWINDPPTCLPLSARTRFTKEFSNSAATRWSWFR